MPAREQATTIQKRKASSPVVEEAFLVIMSVDGDCWDGTGWVGGWANAKRFTPLPDAYEACAAEARSVQEVTGVLCSQFYIQRTS
jgi:hypothetical protein